MIYIEVLRLNWEPGSILLKGYPDRVKKDFENYMCNEYIRLVKSRVNTQLYQYKWAPLSPLYLKYKRENSLSEKTWEATGELMKNLKVKRGKVIGFDNRRQHSNSDETYLEIARKLEYGNSSIPARPLFRLVYWYMSKHVSEYFIRFNKGRITL